MLTWPEPRRWRGLLLGAEQAADLLPKALDQGHSLHQPLQLLQAALPPGQLKHPAVALLAGLLHRQLQQLLGLDQIEGRAQGPTSLASAMGSADWTAASSWLRRRVIALHSRSALWSLMRPEPSSWFTRP